MFFPLLPLLKTQNPPSNAQTRCRASVYIGSRNPMPRLAHFRAKHDAPPKTAPESTASILHIDMDAFFVSVELLSRPDLLGLPVVVGGQRDQRGVVSSASYEARRFGIHSAMPLRTAAKLCPQAVFLDGHHEQYGQWSDRVAEILAKFSPVVEMASIDEAYLDLAGSERLLGPPLAATHKLLREITSATRLPCSGGLGATRLVAKVASDQAKPRGLVWVPPGSEAAFLAPLAVRRIPGIGRVTEAALKSLGIETVGQLQQLTLERLEEVFGRWGTALFRKAHGIDSYEFFVDAEPKSLSHNQTFGTDTNNREQLESTLSYLCQKASKRLRDTGLHARTVSLTLRYIDFKTITRSQTLGEPSDLDTVFLKSIRELFGRVWNGAAMLRLVGVELSMFSAGPAQLDLLDPGRREKLERLARATDLLRDRFGFSKVQFGGSLNAKEKRD
jgi:DNA polymerase-4